MNIRVKLIQDPSALEAYNKMKEALIEKKPELAEALSKEDPTKTYIELDTGGQFDSMTEKAQELIRELVGIILEDFGNLLLTELNYDLRVNPSNTMERTLGIQVGLRDIRRTGITARLQNTG